VVICLERGANDLYMVQMMPPLPPHLLYKNEKSGTRCPHCPRPRECSTPYRLARHGPLTAWHYAMTKAQTEQIEAVQKRAIHIVLNFSRGMPYMAMLSAANLSTLASRREEMSMKFFLHISQPTSLHHLLPDPRDDLVISRLRTYEKYPRVFTRTKRYCSFIQYALNHYQNSISNS